MSSLKAHFQEKHDDFHLAALFKLLFAAFTDLSSKLYLKSHVCVVKLNYVSLFFMLSQKKKEAW